MRELTTMEVEYVSGAGYISRIGAGVAGLVMGMCVGALDVGVAGGSAGGILGVGAISALGGVIVGALGGALIGGMYGMMADWDKTSVLFMKTFEQLMDRFTPKNKV